MSDDLLTEDQARELLKEMVRQEGVSNTRFAMNHGIWVSDMSNFTRGIRRPTTSLLDAIGLRKVVRYAKKE